MTCVREVHVDLACDCCGAVMDFYSEFTDPPTTIKAARVVAAEHGWTRNAVDDLCPRCTRELAEIDGKVQRRVQSEGEA